MGIAAALVALVKVRDRWVEARWRAAARRLGLRFRSGCLVRGDRIWGQRGAYRVELDNLKRKHTLIVLHAERLPTNLHCGLRSQEDLPVDDQTGVGDHRFDRMIRVCGPRDEILARLDHQTRRTLLEVLNPSERRPPASIVVTGGRVTYYAEYRIESATRLERIIGQLACIADVLTLDEDIPTRLYANACDVREPIEVRRHNLRTLVTSHVDSTQTNRACAQLIDDEDPWIRLEAAGQRQDDDDGRRRVLRALVEDRCLPDNLRILALKAAHSPLADRLAAQSMLTKIVDDPSPAVRGAIAHALAKHTVTDPIVLLRLAEDPDDDVASAAIRGLAQTGGVASGRAEWASIEPALVRAVTSGPYAVRLAAAETLAVVGRPFAVEALRALLRTSVFDPRLRTAARHAIRAINVRARSGQTGQLSLISDQDARGMLSEHQSGGLSEAPTAIR